MHFYAVSSADIQADSTYQSKMENGLKRMHLAFAELQIKKV